MFDKNEEYKRWSYGRIPVENSTMMRSMITMRMIQLYLVERLDEEQNREKREICVSGKRGES